MILEEEREKVEDQLASKDRDFQEPQLSKASPSVYGVFQVKAIAWPLHTVLHVCKISYCTGSAIGIFIQLHHAVQFRYIYIYRCIRPQTPRYAQHMLRSVNTTLVVYELNLNLHTYKLTYK